MPKQKGIVGLDELRKKLQNAPEKLRLQELYGALRQEAMRYRGQEQQVIDFFRKNPEAMENLRAPIFEEKVVDFILELAKVAERQVKPEELSEA